MQEFSTSVPMLLYRALATVMPRFRAIFARHGLTEPQWRVLRVLWEHAEMSPGELAALTLIPAPSLVGVIDRLAHNKLVRRRRSAHDRRSVVISTTAAGAALEAEVMPAVESAYAELKAGLDPQTWTELQQALTALARIPAP